MPPPPSPGPLDVNVHTGPAEWWQFLAGLAPVAVLAAGIIAAVIAWKTLKQKTSSDNRAEWWRRAEWAFDVILSEEPRRAQVGLQVMTVLAESTPSREEVEFTTVAWGYPLEEAAEWTAVADTVSASETELEGSELIVYEALDRDLETGNNESTIGETG